MLPRPPILVGAEAVARGKPHPAGYLTAARRLGMRPAECVVIDDAPSGLMAARAAGMPVIVVATTHSTSQVADADVRVWTLTDIRVEQAGLAVSCVVLPDNGVRAHSAAAILE